MILTEEAILTDKNKAQMHNFIEKPLLKSCYFGLEPKGSVILLNSGQLIR